MIKHIWFDFSDTLAFINTDAHNKLRYETYSQVVGKPVTNELITEYEELYAAHQKSNAAVFRSLDKSSNFWSESINSVEPSVFYRLADKDIPELLAQLKEKVPISIFSNIEIDKVLDSLAIKPEWFTNILSSGMVKEPKPALDGFYKMIELSNLAPEEILYIGDDVGKDVVPAHAVGIKTGILWKDASEADYSFKEFKDIFTIIQ